MTTFICKTILGALNGLFIYLCMIWADSVLHINHCKVFFQTILTPPLKMHLYYTFVLLCCHSLAIFTAAYTCYGQQEELHM